MNEKISPNFMEHIVCLANSRKISGRCIAGKRVGDKTWCRPVSSRLGHEISETDRQYQDGKTARILEVISIPCAERQPHAFQHENVLIDDRFYWQYKRRAKWDEVRALVDRDADLWQNGFSAYYNKNNRVPEVLLNNGSGSLRLIELDKMVLHVVPKAPNFGNNKLTVRASFEYGGNEYKLDVTDPVFESDFLEQGPGDYTLETVVACISLGELHTNQNGETFAYKLVASIIDPERAGA